MNSQPLNTGQRPVVSREELRLRRAAALGARVVAGRACALERHAGVCTCIVDPHLGVVIRRRADAARTAVLRALVVGDGSGPVALAPLLADRTETVARVASDLVRWGVALCLLAAA